MPQVSCAHGSIRDITLAHEFTTVYPKAKAIELARVTHFPVLYTAVEISPEVLSPITSPDEPVVVSSAEAARRCWP